MQFKPCNMHRCQMTAALKKEKDATIRCVSKLDIILLLDAGGNIGQLNFDNLLKAGKLFVKALEGGDDGVQIAVLAYAGKANMKEANACVHGKGDEDDDILKTCG